MLRRAHCSAHCLQTHKSVSNSTCSSSSSSSKWGWGRTCEVQVGVEHGIEDVREQLHLLLLLLTLPPAFPVLPRPHGDVTMARDDGVLPGVLRLDVGLHVAHLDEASMGTWGALGATMIHGDAPIPDFSGHTCNMASGSFILRGGGTFGHALESPAKQLALGGEDAHLVVVSNDDDGLVQLGRRCISFSMQRAPEAEAPRMLQLVLAPISNIFTTILVVVRAHEVGAQEVQPASERVTQEARGRGAIARHEVEGRSRGTRSRGDRKARGRGAIAMHEVEGRG